MGLKHVSPEPSPCHDGRRARTHLILNAGRSHLAAARLATRVRRIRLQLGGAADRAMIGRSQRGPPITQRSGPAEPPADPDHPNTQSATHYAERDLTCGQDSVLPAG
jgi:hypothetical protein